MKTLLKNLLRDKRGTSALEMGIICSLIVLAMMGALQGFASENERTWSGVSAKVGSAISGAVNG